MLVAPRLNKLTMVAVVLLLLTAVAAFPCAASAMATSDSTVEAVSETEAHPRADLGHAQGTLLSDNPEIGPLIGALIVGVVSGLIVAAITNPSTTVEVVNDVVNFVADAYESHGETCVTSPGSC